MLMYGVKYLARNKIVSSRLLKKIYAPHLKTLAIDKNYINDFDETLPFCSWIGSINSLQIQSYPQSRTQSETINWFSKIMPGATQDLRFEIRSTKRIKQKLVEKIRKQFRQEIKVYDKEEMGYLVSDGQSSFSGNDS